jgi:hypothetical protein
LDLDRIRALVDDADARPRQTAGGAHAGEASFFRARYGDQYATRGLGEQRHERIGTLGKDDAATGFTGQSSFDDGLRETTLGQIVCRRDQSVTRGREQNVGEQLLASEIDLGRNAAEVIVLDLRPDGSVELVVGVAQQNQRLTGFEAETGVGRIGSAPVWL